MVDFPLIQTLDCRRNLKTGKCEPSYKVTLRDVLSRFLPF